MSTETKELLDEAIKNHFKSENDGAYLTDYVLAATGVPSDSDHSYEYMYSCSDSSFHAIYGLIHMAKDRFLNDGDIDD